MAALKATIAAGIRPSSAEARVQKLLRAFQGIEEHIRARLAHIRASRSDEAGGSKTLADVFHQIYLEEDSSVYGSSQFSQFADTFRKQEINSLIHQAAKLTAQKKVRARPGAADEESESQKPGGKGAQQDQGRNADKNKGKDKGKKPLKDPKDP